MVRKRTEGPKAKANETLFLKTKMCRRQLIVSRREKSSMMNKMIKKISAVALAAAMTLSTGVAAQAATLKVYFREWTQGESDNTYLGKPTLTTYGTEPVLEVSGIEADMTYKEALDEAVANYNGKYVLGWNEKNDQYLDYIVISGKKVGIKGENTNPKYDSNKNMISATWVGSSWMWYPGSDIELENTSSYPKTTLGETYVPVKTANNDKEIVSMVLSYDTTHFFWTNEGNN